MCRQLTYVLEVDIAHHTDAIQQLHSRLVQFFMPIHESLLVSHIVGQVIGQYRSIGECLLTAQMVALKHFNLRPAQLLITHR